MNRDEIKNQYSMREIVERYGFHPNRAGFISCPFHSGDHSPSMKIYPKDFYCHACGSHGDIFSFIQQMENCSFKDAFYSLGGTYEKPTFSSQLAVYRSEKKKIEREKREQRLRDRKQLNAMLIDIYRHYRNISEPLSDAWCDSVNALQYQLYLHGELNDIPY
ncbi:MAG: DNA primase [Eubacterium sp.]|nr:DNA primase [Eubacterium sp.]